jgi:hypothetical protein
MTEMMSGITQPYISVTNLETTTCSLPELSVICQLLVMMAASQIEEPFVNSWLLSKLLIQD